MQRERALEIGDHVIAGLAGIVGRDQAEALDRRAGIARIAHGGLDPVDRARERSLGLAVAELSPADQVGPDRLVEDRCFRRQGGFRIDHGGQGLVARVDRGQGVFRAVAVVRHHDGDRLAGMANPVGGDAPVLHGLAQADQERRRPGARVLARDHGMHAFEGERPARIDAEQAGMGVGRAQDGGMTGAGRDRQVVDIAAPAREQGRVLDALQRRAGRAQPAPPSVQRGIRPLDGSVSSATLRAVSMPATGRPCGSSRPICTSTEA